MQRALSGLDSTAAKELMLGIVGNCRAIHEAMEGMDKDASDAYLESLTPEQKCDLRKLKVIQGLLAQ